MIFWRGYGFAAILIWALGGVLVQAVVEAATGVRDMYKTHLWAGLLQIILPCITIWLVGMRLEKRPTRVVVDQQSGETIRLAEKHDLFWIPFKWWGWICFAMAVWVQYLK